MKRRNLFLTGALLAIATALLFTVVHDPISLLSALAGVGGTVLMANTPIVLTPEIKTALEEIKNGIEKNSTAYKTLDDKLKNFDGDLGEIFVALKDHLADQDEKASALKKFGTLLKKVFSQVGEQAKLIAELRKQRASIGSGSQSLVRIPGRPARVSEEVARFIGAYYIAGMAARGHITSERAIDAAREILGIQGKAGLTTTEIPLPTSYTSQLRELIEEYGVVRQNLTGFPMGQGTTKPPRMGTEDDFGLIAMAVAFGEKLVRITFGALESHKVGGIVLTPREIDDQSIVPLGQYLARYGARKFAKAEDTWGFLADGSGTYDSVKGICKIAVDDSRVVTLGAGKTAPSDAVLEDFRSLRGLVKSPVIGSGKYYMHITWERRLRTFKTQADPMIYVQNGPMGTPTLDGYPVVWTEVLQPYTTDAAASKHLAVFGDLSYWWFGERGAPRQDFSTEAYFTSDQLATRFMEEIDFEYADIGCASTLRTAA